jgi:RNA polymerase sigma-70 factor (ECF subfamily)
MTPQRTEDGPEKPPEAAGSAPAAEVPDADFRALYETHFRLVWSALARLGVREVDLMDLTQKVFLTAYLKLPDFQGRSKLSTWLWGICRRVAIGYRRSSAVRYEVATDPESLVESTERLVEQPVDDDIDTDRAADMARILGKISEAQRLVFVLFEVDELDGPEIALLLGISLGTVRSRLRYARLTFRREVERLALERASLEKRRR